MRSVVVVLPASMCAMIPMFRMRRTSSSTDDCTAAAVPGAPSASLEAEAAEPRLLDAPLAIAAAAAGVGLAFARGVSNDGPARRRSIPLRPRFSNSDMPFNYLRCPLPSLCTRGAMNV